jgi:CBS domain-containing protein
MNEPLARSLMTSQVTTIPPEMPVADIARLLAEHGISAVPVVAMDGSLLGLVTEADLICRLAARLDEAPSWLGALFADPAKAAERYARAHGFIAEEVMTTEVVTIPPDMPAAEIAATLERHRIRRVLVVERGRLLGVVSRRDLLRVVESPERELADVPDERVRRAIVATMRRQPWAASALTVEVHNGVVEFHGFSPGPPVQRALRVMAEQVPGVKQVSDQTVPIPADIYGYGAY